MTLSSGSSPDTVHRIAENSDGAEMASPINSPSNSPPRTSFHENDNQKTNSEASLWLGSRGAGGKFRSMLYYYLSILLTHGFIDSVMIFI